MQVLGARRRADLLEWRRTALTQEAYARIGASLVLKDRSERTPEQWRRHLVEAVQAEQAALKPALRFRIVEKSLRNIPWLEAGMDEAAVLGLFGEKNLTREGSDLVYTDDFREEDGSGMRYVLRVPLEGGVFRKLTQNWMEWTELPPEPRSLAWAEAGLKLDEGKPAALTEKDVRTMFDSFAEQAPHAGPDTWSRWCSIVEELAEKGREHRDERVPAVLCSRFFEMNLSQAAAVRALEHYRLKDLGSMVARRQRLLLGMTENFPPSDLFDDTESLLGYVPKDHPEFASLVRDGLAHSHKDIRHDALRHSPVLGRQVAHDEARKALEGNADWFVRSTAIDVLKKTGGEANIEWLRPLADKEKDQYLKKKLDELITQFGKTPASSSR